MPYHQEGRGGVCSDTHQGTGLAGLRWHLLPEVLWLWAIALQQGLL